MTSNLIRRLVFGATTTIEKINENLLASKFSFFCFGPNNLMCESRCLPITRTCGSLIRCPPPSFKRFWQSNFFLQSSYIPLLAPSKWVIFLVFNLFFYSSNFGGWLSHNILLYSLSKPSCNFAVLEGKSTHQGVLLFFIKEVDQNDCIKELILNKTLRLWALFPYMIVN